VINFSCGKIDVCQDRMSICYSIKLVWAVIYSVEFVHDVQCVLHKTSIEFNLRSHAVWLRCENWITHWKCSYVTECWEKQLHWNRIWFRDWRNSELEKRKNGSYTNRCVNIDLWLNESAVELNGSIAGEVQNLKAVQRLIYCRNSNRLGINEMKTE